MKKIYMDVKSNLFDIITNRKCLAFLDFVYENDRLFLIDDILYYTKLDYVYSVYVRHDMPNAAIILMDIKKKDYDRVIDYIENMPVKLKIFLGREAAEIFDISINKFNEIYKLDNKGETYGEEECCNG